MAWQDEWRTVECLGGCSTAVFTQGGPEAQPDLWEMVYPVGCRTAGAERVLEAAVEAFYQAVGLRVVNWAPRSEVMTSGTPNLLTHP